MKEIRMAYDESFYDRYDSGRVGVMRIVESYPIIQQKTINELKGKFEKQELYYLFDMRNGSVFDPKFINNELICWEIDESEKYENLGHKYIIEIEKLKEKTNKLSISQLYVLIDWIDIFWYGSQDKKLDKYISKLLS